MLKINGKNIKAIKIYGKNIVRAYCEGKLVFGNTAQIFRLDVSRLDGVDVLAGDYAVLMTYDGQPLQTYDGQNLMTER